MVTRKSDTIRIRHMVDAAKKIIQFTKSKTRTDLDTDEQLALALVRLVEIIGEAAAKVTEDSKVQFSDVPWVNIVGTRNRLIHAYEDVDYEILWQIISSDVPILVPQLEQALLTLDRKDQRGVFS